VHVCGWGGRDVKLMYTYFSFITHWKLYSIYICLSCDIHREVSSRKKLHMKSGLLEVKERTCTCHPALHQKLKPQYPPIYDNAYHDISNEISLYIVKERDINLGISCSVSSSISDS